MLSGCTASSVCPKHMEVPCKGRHSNPFARLLHCLTTSVVRGGEEVVTHVKQRRKLATVRVQHHRVTFGFDPHLGRSGVCDHGPAWIKDGTATGVSMVWIGSTTIHRYDPSLILDGPSLGQRPPMILAGRWPVRNYHEEFGPASGTPANNSGKRRS